ncbi:sulfatase [Martelella lutilitoris]|uniref:Sulfatase n=1 Tax=Martelella lutilitoris TaxID=2583532 RepID=A0A5C4JL94_9HYPH|nr:sulfatase [Martelella lutilitoris]TNB46233.1 sulfatase [Martelella lutilitoris]
MRTIIVMFDSLNRRMLPPYGGDPDIAPNFARLARRAVTFDRCYAGSMPCIPARREMHTGRYNFLHRSWSPLEPFDDSVPQMLKEAGIYTHLITDHQHYWEDGGATYHNRYASYEFFRGQEGDLWKPDVAASVGASLTDIGPRMRSQDAINRAAIEAGGVHPQTGVFEAGLSFLRDNAKTDNWMVQIETFDPHEPFYSSRRHMARFNDPQGSDATFDWPPYARVTEDEATEEVARNRYLALLSMCDENLGRVLDLMDEQEMWGDTALLVCTDHGYMLGEKGWWGKSVQPWYEETIHTPLFFWDPRAGIKGKRRRALVQTIDFGPTLLDLFGQQPTKDMQGHSLALHMEADRPRREAALFGSHGSHVNVTDGRYVYMRAPVSPANAPLYEYTLMPMHMRAMASPEALSRAEFVPGFSFTKGCRLLRLPAWGLGNPFVHGTLLFDLETDPDQATPLRDDALETRMATLLVKLMRESEAPPEQFERLGLPQSGAITPDRLLVARQAEQAARARKYAVRRDAFPPDAIIRSEPVGKLLQIEAARPLLIEAFPLLANAAIPSSFGHKTVIEVAAMQAGTEEAELRALEGQLKTALATD